MIYRFVFRGYSGYGVSRVQGFGRGIGATEGKHKDWHKGITTSRFPALVSVLYCRRLRRDGATCGLPRPLSWWAGRAPLVAPGRSAGR